jgi:hypothetical protein
MTNKFMQNTNLILFSFLVAVLTFSFIQYSDAASAEEKRGEIFCKKNSSLYYADKHTFMEKFGNHPYLKYCDYYSGPVQKSSSEKASDEKAAAKAARDKLAAEQAAAYEAAKKAAGKTTDSDKKSDSLRAEIFCKKNSPLYYADAVTFVEKFGNHPYLKYCDYYGYKLQKAISENTAEQQAAAKAGAEQAAAKAARDKLAAERAAAKDTITKTNNDYWIKFDKLRDIRNDQMLQDSKKNFYDELNAAGLPNPDDMKNQPSVQDMLDKLDKPQPFKTPPPVFVPASPSPQVAWWCFWCR